MDKRLKEDHVLRSCLSYVVKEITGQEEFTGGIEIVFFKGGLRNTGPRMSADVHRKEMARLIAPSLPSQNYSGTVIVDTNLGVVTHIRVK